MMERVNYGSEYDDHDEEEEHHEDGYEDRYKEDPSEEYKPAYPENTDDVYAWEDHARSLMERVEHQADHDADARAQSEFDAQFGWRSKGRRDKKGRWVPPDTRLARTPVFVRVADLPAKTTADDRAQPNAGETEGQG